MKKIVFVSLGASVLLALAGCSNDLLDEQPESVLVPAFLTTPQGIEAGLTGTYSGLRNIYGNEGAFFMTEAGTDAWTLGVSASSGLMDYNGNDLTPANAGSALYFWSNAYIYINDANGVLKYAPTVQGLTPSRVQQIVAEAKLLRAQYYFQLVQQFGDVPLMLTFIEAPTKALVRAPTADVYNAIITDLNDALNTIADRPAQPGRVTRATALHLLSKVYLTRATSVARQADDYTNAARLAEELINNQARYGVGLEADPAAVFAEGNENGKEVLFNVQFNADPTFTQNNGNDYGGASVANFIFRSRYDQIPNMIRDIANGRPFARFSLNRYQENAFILRDANGNPLETGSQLRTTDTRYSKWYTTVYRVNSPGNNGGSANAVVGDTAVWYPGRQLTAAELTRIANRRPVPYRVYQPSQYTTEYYPTLNKFDSRTRTIVNGFSIRPLTVFRFAETYLIAAEANMYLGNLTQARDYLNVVRRRAAAPGKTAQMEITTGQVNIDFILDERLRELAGEHMRWYDLKRTGKLLERVRNPNIASPFARLASGVYGSNAAINIKDFHVLRPIPQQEIDRTSGGITQNPGY